MIDLPPGQELDRLIFRTVVTGGVSNEELERWSESAALLLSPYSTDISAAESLFGVLPERWLAAFDGRWHIRETLSVTHHGESGEVTYATRPLASGETLPHAVCLAALKLKGVE
jgi:hypothetical protein